MSPGAGGDEGQRPLLAGRPSSSIDEDDARDYGSNSQSLREEQPVQRRRFESTLGTGAAYGILIGIVIGSGIFTSPGSIDTNVPSPGMALVMWLVGGILVWTGAATFAELGTAIPGEGRLSSSALIVIFTLS
jgi:L-type amino acid transporter 9